MLGQPTFHFALKLSKSFCSFRTTIILIDAQKDIFLSQKLDEVQDGLPPSTPDKASVYDIGSDEDLFIVWIGEPGLASSLTQSLVMCGWIGVGWIEDGSKNGEQKC